MPDVAARYPPLNAAAIDAVTDATALIAGQRLPGGLSAGETARLRTRTAQLLAAAERLHAYPLGNGDEPAFVLGLPGDQR
jgi:hypothetical protein